MKRTSTIRDEAILLRIIRRKKDITATEISEKLGVTKSYISQVENCVSAVPSYRVLIDWLEVLGMKPKHFESLLKSEKNIILRERKILEAKRS